MVKEEMHLQEHTVLTLTLGNVVQYSLHHVTYAPVKFAFNTLN